MKRKLRLMERILLLRIQENTRTPKRTLFFKAMTRLGDMGAIWILLSLGLLAKKKTRKTGYICTLALVLSPLINDGILKNIFQRKRPFRAIKELRPLIKKPNDYSFPSGHTSSSFAVAGVLHRCISWKAGLPAYTLASLIGFSRMYLGVHYPSDVLCGMLCGLGISRAAVDIISKPPVK